MKQASALALAVLLTFNSCATLAKMPTRVEEAFSDPVRQQHIMSEFSLQSSAFGVAIGCAGLLAPTIVGILVCPIIGMTYYFAVYEFVLEPISKERVLRGEPSLVGPYWERGPHIDLGERYIFE